MIHTIPVSNLVFSPSDDNSWGKFWPNQGGIDPLPHHMFLL